MTTTTPISKTACVKSSALLGEKVSGYWNTRAEGYSLRTADELNGPRGAHWRERLLSNLRGVPPGGSVLDVGCGPALLAITAARCGWKAYGCDSSPEMLRRALENAKTAGAEVTFCQCDAAALPFADETFDAVISRNVLWNLPHPERALKEWMRVLKPGGRLLYEDGNHYRHLVDPLFKHHHDNMPAPFGHQPQYMLNVDTSAIDAIAQTLPLTQEPQRIIVANYIQNFMLVGGRDALKRVVGMTQDHWESTRMGEYQVFTTAYPELKSIPSIGGFHDDILNSEKIIALKPDAMIINRTQFAANTQRIEVFERAGIRVIVTDYHAMKLENHVLSTRIIGRMLGRDTVAEELCRKAIDGLKDVDARVAKASAGKKAPKVYMELGSKGVGNYGNTYNSTILWGAMLARAGADSISANNREPYSAATREYVISQNPEIIIIGGSRWSGGASDQMQMGFTVERKTAEKCLEAFMHRSLWQNLPAVKNRRFYAVDHGSLRSIIDWHMSVFIAKVCWPEGFADMDPEAGIVADYKHYLPDLDPAGTFTLALGN